MAIVQISRITNRKGLTVDLPSPLAGAELGWATDERRLFIGNGTLAEGAPVVGNICLVSFCRIKSYVNQLIACSGLLEMLDDRCCERSASFANRHQQEVCSHLQF